MQNHSPAAQYQQLVASKTIHFDASQQQAVEYLECLYQNLCSQRPNSKVGFANHVNEPVKGIYLWGKVGRGKTFLMDLFVDCINHSGQQALCKRQHFHHFMQHVHRQLNELKGKHNPLKHIADNFAKQYKVLCFDEFFVSDIGDAMLLGNLLQFMFALNVIVVSTSNCAPNELYKNGLQRQRFLPAIDAINQQMHILHLQGGQDHRLRQLTYRQNYFVFPPVQQARALQQQAELHQNLLTTYGLPQVSKSQVSKSQLKANNTDYVIILGRKINVIAQNNIAQKNGLRNKSVCFDFSQLCEGPRSHLDYVELAKQYKTILLFNVPPMSGQSYERIKARGTEDNGSSLIHNSAKHNVAASITGEREVVLAPMDDAARRFIALVDECYDNKIHLVLTAYVEQHQLYNSGSLTFEFERTKSRLVEMASKEYLQQT